MVREECIHHAPQLQLRIVVIELKLCKIALCAVTNVNAVHMVRKNEVETVMQ